MIKTTLEMDGLFTQQDIDNRFLVMRQCKKCSQWSQHDTRDDCWKCACGGEGFADQRSIRSWLVTKDTKVRKTRKKTSA